MHNELNADTWIWVVVQDAGGNEQFVGQHNEETNVSFIPAFYQKEDAEQCLIRIARQKGKTYEVQAVLFENLSQDASKNGFNIFMLSAEGDILKKITP
jgi:hypothetical protein